MAFDKTISAKIAEYKIFNVDSTDELIKEASDVDFPEGFTYDPDFLYLWVRIVSAGEFYGSNKNADYFPKQELIDYFETFNEAHPFKNHENKNVENAIGRIITVRWNPVMKCVELLKAIDKKRAPEIARGYLKGYLSDVSMGCKVPYTVCSICGNKARKKSEFCNHVKYYRNQLLANGERVYEINYKPRFHDSSTVLNGAERVAKAFFIIDAPPENAIVSSFRKAASTGNTSHFIPISSFEMEKVAEYKESLHPLLKEAGDRNLQPGQLKTASSSPMMRKIAELEKELTGKLLNIVSQPDPETEETHNQMLEIIKFLTEKRMDEDSITRIATSLKEAAQEHGVPPTQAFTTLIGVAELMGVEFFPTELHKLLTHMTDAKLNPNIQSAAVPADPSPVYPSEYTSGMERAVNLLDTPKAFNDPASLLSFYDEAAHRTKDFLDTPHAFLNAIPDYNDLEMKPPVRMIRIIRKTLEPIAPMRSYHPEHLYPRLSLVLNGQRPVIGNEDVRRDLEMVANPSSIADLIGGIAYSLYEKSRPAIRRSRFIKIAADAVDGFHKTAAAIPAWKLALVGVPAAYAASAFEKSRRDGGRYLTDGENFIADKPGFVAGGAVLGAKPAAMAVNATMRGGKKVTDSVKRGGQKAKDKWDELFTKESHSSFEGLVKNADAVGSGAFNVFQNQDVLRKFAAETGATPEEASAIKMATLLSFGGMEKESYEILDHYGIPKQAKSELLKVAADYMDDELSKAAEDFTNNMILSVVGDHSPLGRSLPGRAVDSFIFKKLGEMGDPDQKKKKKSKPDIETPSSTQPWTQNYRQGPALQTQSKGENS